MKYLVTLLLLIPGYCQAGWQEKATDAVLYISGIAASFFVHEMSHELTARAYGENLDWSDGRWTCRSPCRYHDQIAISGNIGTAILGESLLLIPEKYRNIPFVDGMQTFNAVNPISYLYKQETKQDGYLDYANLDGSYKKYESVLAVHAATIGYRQFAKRIWSITVTPRSIQFNARF